MTHYEVLGVAPDAPAGEVRRAYLREARRHHPDRHAGAAPSATAGRDAAERRMRELNEAWSVLRDPDRRAAYDRSLRSGGPAPPSTAAGPGVVHTPSRDFTPFHAVDADDDDSWRYEPDRHDPETALGRVLAVGPAALVLLGLALGAVGLVLGGHRAVVAAAFAALLLGGLGFVLAPLVAVSRSAHHDRRPAGPRPGRR